MKEDVDPRESHPMIEAHPTDLLGELTAWMHQHPSVLVAYSGGVDSALVMAVAHQELGARSLACIGESPSYPKRELDAAVRLAQSLGAALRILHTQEHLNASYAQNPQNRCYFCKSELFGRLVQMAQSEGYAAILDGTNADDAADFRPGRKAAQEQGVRSPLLELGITKAHVREMARRLRLPVADKPASPCLSSRVPHGTAITPEILRQIESTEDALVALGFRDFRVRHHGDIARIELPIEELPRAVEMREQIVRSGQRAGYRYITLDLAGLRSGGMTRPAYALVQVGVERHFR